MIGLIVKNGNYIIVIFIILLLLPSKKLRYKKSFIKIKTPDFDIDYKLPNEEETNSYWTSNNTSSSTLNYSAHTNTQNQDAF